MADDGARQLAAAVLNKPIINSFCSIPIKELRADNLSKLNLSGTGKQVGVPGALVVAHFLRVSPSLTRVCPTLDALPHAHCSRHICVRASLSSASLCLFLVHRSI
mmetsp:Transcript_16243/g.44192  ORF Transcript_16243/g.44192 Transcript_16243/m.44192 type:complete len:105 (-) Transcript_16243:1269-1583(-)